MVRIQRFNVVKTATVAAVMYMIVIAIFVVPFVALVAIAGVSAPGVQAGQTVGGALVVGARRGPGLRPHRVGGHGHRLCHLQHRGGLDRRDRGPGRARRAAGCTAGVDGPGDHATGHASHLGPLANAPDARPVDGAV